MDNIRMRAHSRAIREVIDEIIIANKEGYDLDEIEWSKRINAHDSGFRTMSSELKAAYNKINELEMRIKQLETKKVS